MPCSRTMRRRHSSSSDCDDRSSSASLAAARTSVVNARPIVAARPIRSRAGSESCASRASIAACTFGLSSFRTPSPRQPARNGFDDEKRVAFRLDVEPVRVVDGRPRGSVRQARPFGPAKPRERNRSAAIERLKSGEEVGKRMAAVEIVVAVRSPRRAAGHPAGFAAGSGGTGAIPGRTIANRLRRAGAALRCSGSRWRDGIEQPLAPVGTRRFVDLGVSGHDRAELRQEACKFCQPSPVQPAKPRPDTFRAQPFNNWSIGERTLRGIRARLGGDGPALRAPPAKLLDEARFADPGLSGDDDELRPAAFARPPKTC